MEKQWILIYALIFALIIAIFAVINVEAVPVNFLVAKPEIPLILIILGSTLLGGLIVGLFGIIRQYKMSKLIVKLQNDLAELNMVAPQGRKQVVSEPIPVLPAGPEKAKAADNGSRKPGQDESSGRSAAISVKPGAPETDTPVGKSAAAEKDSKSGGAQ